MPEFFFQIKAKKGGEGHAMYGFGNWSFPPVWQDKIEADDYDQAKLKIEQLYGKKFPLRVLKKDLDSNEFLLSITELRPDNFLYENYFKINECKNCGQKFKVIEKYQIGSQGGGKDYCSAECKREQYEVEWYKSNERDGNSAPIIYKITNKESQKCYIGKTTQVFTLRWYQHFFQSKNNDTKFYQAIRETKLTDWRFEILEVIVMPQELKTKNDIDRFVFEREVFYIRQHNSIQNGYNSVISLTEKANQLQLELKLEQETDV